MNESGDKQSEDTDLFREVLQLKIFQNLFVDLTMAFLKACHQLIKESVDHIRGVGGIHDV